MKIRVLFVSCYYQDKQWDKVCEFARFPQANEDVSLGDRKIGVIVNVDHNIDPACDYVATVVCYYQGYLPGERIDEFAERLLLGAGFKPFSPGLQVGP